MYLLIFLDISYRRKIRILRRRYAEGSQISPNISIEKKFDPKAADGAKDLNSIYKFIIAQNK